MKTVDAEYIVTWTRDDFEAADIYDLAPVLLDTGLLKIKRFEVYSGVTVDLRLQYDIIRNFTHHEKTMIKMKYNTTKETVYIDRLIEQWFHARDIKFFKSHLQQMELDLRGFAKID